VRVGPALTEEQRAAVEAPLAPLLVIAGAGSGKTTVMAQRVVHLVGAGAVAPDEVLGLTFTTKAAGELGARIRAALLAEGLVTPLSAGAPAEDPPGQPVAATYNAYAARLVREHGLLIGVEPGARVLTEGARHQAAVRVLRRHRTPFTALTGRLATVAGQVVDLEERTAEHGVALADVEEHARRWVTAVESERQSLLGRSGVKTRLDLLEELSRRARARVELTELAEALRAERGALDALDFTDQVVLAGRLALEHPVVSHRERTRAKVVLLDEYQDTSVAQRRLLRALFGAGHPVTAVGDPRQSIYGWRGASVQGIKDFPTDFPSGGGAPARRLSLRTCFRSEARIVGAANDLAAGLEAAAEDLLPAPTAAEGAVEVALHLRWADEAAWVAARIRAEVDAGTPPAQCAVLTRARRDIPEVHRALQREGLPVEVVGIGGLLALPEVGDVVAVLRVLEDPTANAALLRLLAGPRWRLGRHDLVVLGARSRHLLRPEGRDRDETRADRALEQAVAGVDQADVGSLLEAVHSPGPVVSPEARARCAELAAELTRLRRRLGDPLAELVHRVVEVTGLAAELAAAPEAETGLGAGLGAFTAVAAGFADLDGGTSLTAFLAYLSVAEQEERGLSLAQPSGRDAVQVLTVHQAKGLEWDVVAVPDLCREVFPATRLDERRWTHTSALVPTALRQDGAGLPDPVDASKQGLEDYDTACRRELAREEQRLGYVAVTRARRLLLASAHWWGPTQKKRRGAGPYLERLRQHDASGGAVWVGEPVDNDNPYLLEDATLGWPAPLDAPAFARREAAGALVRQSDPADRDVTGLSEPEQLLLAGLDGDADLLLADLAAQHDPVRTVALPASLSATQLQRLRLDPEGLAVDLARPMPRRPSPRARQGTLFHAWVEQRSGQRPLLAPDDLPGASDDEDAASLAGSRPDLAALQQAFLQTTYGERTPYVVEAPFALRLAGRVVRGRIDAVYRDESTGRWEVVDWKTGGEGADPVQLAVYRTAWARQVQVAEDEVDATFLYVRSGRVERPSLLAAGELEALLRPGPR